MILPFVTDNTKEIKVFTWIIHTYPEAIGRWGQMHWPTFGNSFYPTKAPVILDYHRIR